MTKKSIKESVVAIRDSYRRSNTEGKGRILDEFE
jgi:hypothetical protein